MTRALALPRRRLARAARDASRGTEVDSYSRRRRIDEQSTSSFLLLDAGAKVQDISLWTLLYRYFFFDWLFKDAGRGDAFQRAAAWRHNRDQARWLPIYMWRWVCLGLMLYGLGSYFEVLLELPELSSFFYIPASLSVPVSAVIAAAWIGLKALPRPL